MLTRHARVLARMERKLLGRLKGVARRGVMTIANSNGQLQTMQVHRLADDVADDVEHMEPYGFTSNPPAGSEGVVINLGGDSAHTVAINFGKRSFRLAALVSGEVALYTQFESSIVLNADGSITLTPAPGQTVKLGGDAAALAVARATDPVGAAAGMIAWMSQVAGAVNGLAAGSVAPPAPVDFGTITTGGIGATAT